MKYTLINPVIGGAFKSTVTASNETEAMHELWKNLSGHLTNNVKTFYTISDLQKNRKKNSMKFVKLLT